jgi:hypothetical protein
MSGWSLHDSADVAQIVTSLVAAIGLAGLLLQVKASNLSTATQFYTELLSKSLEYPQLLSLPKNQLISKIKRLKPMKKNFVDTKRSSI